MTDRRAHILVYNPDPDRELQLTIDAMSLHTIRHVRLLSEGKELALGRAAAAVSNAAPPPVPATGRPARSSSSKAMVRRGAQPREAAWTCDMGPYSLKVDRLELAASLAVASRTAEKR